MGQPITWRNVEAPSFDGASRMLAQAQVGINSGFDKFNQVLQNEQATAEANWKVQRDNNTQAFLNSINQYRTPEEYQAALASGALSTNQYGAQIDQAAARAALDGRLSVLQDRAIKAGQFADQQQERESRPIVDRLNMMNLSEDKDVRQSAKEALGIYAANGMVPKASEVAGNIRNTEHQNVTWDREDKKFKDDLLTSASRRSVDAAQIRSADADVAYKKQMGDAAVARAAAEKGAGSGGKFNPAALEEMISGSKYHSSGTLDTKEGRDTFYKGLKDLNLTPKQFDDVVQNFNDLAAKGIVGKDSSGKTVRMPLPVEAALQSVARSSDPTYYLPMVSMRGNTAADHYRKFLGDNVDDVVREYNAIDQARNNLVYPSLVNDAARGIKADKALENARTGKEEVLPVSRTTVRRSIFQGGALPDDVDTGNALVQQAIQSRAERNARALEMMTPEERQKSKDNPGWLPFRVKKFLEAENQY